MRARACVCVCARARACVCVRERARRRGGWRGGRKNEKPEKERRRKTVRRRRRRRWPRVVRRPRRRDRDGRRLSVWRAPTNRNVLRKTRGANVINAKPVCCTRPPSLPASRPRLVALRPAGRHAGPEHVQLLLLPGRVRQLSIVGVFRVLCISHLSITAGRARP